MAAPIQKLTEQQLVGSLIVAVLTHHKAEIDADKLSWLRGFLRQHFSRAEYRIIANVMGWSRPRRQLTDPAAAPAAPELADDIPF
jgi:hypothetical protein